MRPQSQATSHNHGAHPAEASRRALNHPAVEDELDVVGPAEVQVLTDDLLKQHAPGHQPVEHLREGELRLQDGHVIAIACGAILRREGVGQTGQPLAQQAIDEGRVQAVTDGLSAGRVGTGQQAVVERVVGDALPRQRPLEILMPVHAELGVVREVRAEREEEGAEVAVHAVDVIMVDHGGGLDHPGIGLARVRVAPFLRAHDRCLLLRLADEKHPLLPREPRQVRCRHLILALPLGEGEQRDTLPAGEPLQDGDEGARDGVHQRRGGERGPPLRPEEVRHPGRTLQARHVHVEVHAINALDFQSHMLPQDRRDGGGLCYAHGNLWLWTASGQPTASRSHDSRCTAPCCFPQPEALIHRSCRTSRRSEAQPR